MKDQDLMYRKKQTAMNMKSMICFLIMLVFTVIMCSCANSENQLTVIKTNESQYSSKEAQTSVSSSEQSKASVLKETTKDMIVTDISRETEITSRSLGKVVCIADEFVNIRQGPGTDTKIIGAFPKGAVADAYLYEPDWVMISYEDISGYVSRDHIFDQSIPDIPVPEGDWTMILIDPDNPLPKQFQVELAEFENGYVDARILDICVSMFDDAKKEGISLVLVDAYRSYERQMELYQAKVERYLREGYELKEAGRIAATITAYPDTSEHQLGLALDIVTETYKIRDRGFEKTRAFKWLVANAHNYGFILRYPESKTAVTKIIYEPWHWRFVGIKAAFDIKIRDICLEEYYK